MPRMVQCEKLGRELPGLEKPPFPGELGQRIYDHISAEAWEMWQEQSRLVINHYGLNLADPDCPPGSAPADGRVSLRRERAHA